MGEISPPSLKNLEKLELFGQRQEIIWAKEIFLCTEIELLAQNKVSKPRNMMTI